MLNIIKAEFIKLKKIKSLNIAFWLVLLSSTAVMALIFWGIASQWVVSGFFANAFHMEDMMKVFLGWLFVYIFCFSFITDSLVFVDKGKWWLLYSKNIRAKYFWAKYFWVCVICFITLFGWIIWALSITYFIYSDITFAGYLDALLQFLNIFLIFFVTILPILLVFTFMAVFGVRAIILGAAIFFMLLFLMFWVQSNNWIIWQTYRILQNYTILWSHIEVTMNALNPDYSTIKREIPESVYKLPEEQIWWTNKEYKDLILGRNKWISEKSYYVSYPNALQMWIDSFSPAKNEFWVWLITMLLFSTIATVYMQKRQIKN